MSDKQKILIVDDEELIDVKSVIKIKPPLVFTRGDAETLVTAMDRVLGEDVPAGRR